VTPRRPLTLGTAGHIDHGKTALVEALTGKNTDRLAEEHRRGISIELGYALLELPDGLALSVVDVPGHERLVRTMVAGATGIDLFLMVISADDGVMPQTREHALVLRSLGVERGVIALSKADLADREARELAAAEATALLPGLALVPVSARTGEGVDELRSALAEAAERATAATPPADPDEPAVLHVDRSFSLRGIGTVVTGTLWSGAIEVGGRVEVLPAGIEARVRSIESHDRPRERVEAGGRVALNLAGLDRTEVGRGEVVVSPGAPLRPSYRLDVELIEELPGPSADGGHPPRVQVHHGTRDAAARLIDLGDRLVQLRLTSPLIARAQDRFVIRRISPPGTLGGGRVLDPSPARHGPGPAVERLRRIRDGGPEEPPARPVATAEPPPAPSPPKPLGERELAVLALLRADGVAPRAPQALADALGVERAEAAAALEALTRAGVAVRVKPAVFYPSERLEEIRERIVALAAASGSRSISLAEVRNALGTSRKYAQALLEHLASTHVTVRHGDRHVLRRAGAGADRAGVPGGPEGAPTWAKPD
jgi:selenocysteine-specific elongation factor